jgi:hypothetical protein
MSEQTNEQPQELTEEQKQAAAQAEVEAQQKAAEKAAKKEADRKQKEADKAAKAEARKAEKEAKAKAKEDEKAAKAAEKEAKKKAAEEAKAASKQPEQNGVRRPRPETLCGKAWAVMDQLSMNQGSPVAIRTLLDATGPLGLNEGNVKAEYARWRKFNGVTGRVMSPEQLAKKDAPAQAPAENAGASDAAPQPPAA